jgi:formate transporter
VTSKTIHNLESKEEQSKATHQLHYCTKTLRETMTRLPALLFFVPSIAAYSSTSSSFMGSSPMISRLNTNTRSILPQNNGGGGSVLKMISTGEDRSEYKNLDLSKIQYTSSVKSPKDTYLAFAEKGASNARMSKIKIFHQSVLSGCYVGFGALLAFTAAGAFADPAIARLVFAAVLPFNLFFIIGTGGQLFTGNAAAVAAARYEDFVDTRQLLHSWAISVSGNLVGCTVFALAAWYSGLLAGPTQTMILAAAQTKVGNSLGVTLVKSVMCNWMVSLAVFFAGSSNSLVGKFVGAWVPGATFVALKLEHLIVNFFIFAAAWALGAPAGVSLASVVFKNLIPVAIGNTFAGAVIVAMNYSYQFGGLGKKSRESFKARLANYDAAKIAAQKVKLEQVFQKSSSVGGNNTVFQQKML